MIDILTDKQVKCRKLHRCVWCGEMIGIGELAQYRAYKFDGEFMTDYMHPECMEACTESDIDSDEGFEPFYSKRGQILDEYMI